MDIVARLADKKIREAMGRGEFDCLPGAGKPLRLDADSNIPEELRAGYRILKNAGYIPPEIEMRNEIVNIRNLLGTIDDDKERSRRQRELNFKLLKLNMIRKRPVNLENFPEYEERIFEKLTG